MARLTISLPDSYAEALAEAAAAHGGNVSGLVARLLERSGIVADPIPRPAGVTPAKAPGRSAVSVDSEVPGSSAWRRARSSTAKGRDEIAAWDQRKED